MSKNREDFNFVINLVILTECSHSDFFNLLSIAGCDSKTPMCANQPIEARHE